MNTALRALSVGALLLFGYGQAWGASFQCMVGLRDGTSEKVAIDADSEQRAKEVAVQKFGQRAWGMMSVGCIPVASAAPSQPPAGSRHSENPARDAGEEILRQNPQLSTVDGWPPTITSFGHFGYCRLWDPTVTPKHRCIALGGGAVQRKPWETQTPGKGFILVVYPETPKVWRVYEQSTAGPGGGRLLAEFDMQGNRGSSVVQTQPSPGQPGEATKDPAKDFQDALRNVFKPK
jgi:hypothetical protein